MRSDSAAALGICKRHGLGAVRHLATADLWLQQRVRQGDLTVRKMCGAANASDQMTKHKAEGAIEDQMAAIGFAFAAAAPAPP